MRSVYCGSDSITLLADRRSWQLTGAPTGRTVASPLTEPRQAVAVGEGGPAGGSSSGGGGGEGGTMTDEDALQARLDALRRG